MLIVVSLITPRTDPQRVAVFYGTMKTPVGETPELEAAAIEETRRNPARFDHTKLVPSSNWEFCKWDRVDTIGFLHLQRACQERSSCFLSAVLKWAAPCDRVGGGGGQVKI